MSGCSFPKDLKITIVVPIPKSQISFDVSTIWPITITSKFHKPVLSKFSKQNVHKRMVRFLNRHKTISFSQFRLRQRMNTKVAISSVTK